MAATIPVSDLGTLLGVWAHPDDEAYLSAGLMAIARRNGQRVVVATATSGELGTPDPTRWPPARLGPHRRREMAASLAALDVTEHRWLGWRDGACHRVADGVGVAQVTRLLDEVRPDTIITFGPDGMTGHADHRAVSRWVTAAWTSAPHARLLYATVTPDFHATWAAVNDDLGVWAEQTNPPCTAPTELAVEVTCDEPLLDQKLAALRAHASQTAALEDRLGMATFRRWWQVEAFVAAPRPGPRPSNPAHERTGASRAHR